MGHTERMMRKIMLVGGLPSWVLLGIGTLLPHGIAQAVVGGVGAIGVIVTGLALSYHALSKTTF